MLSGNGESHLHPTQSWVCDIEVTILAFVFIVALLLVYIVH